MQELTTAIAELKGTGIPQRIPVPAYRVARYCNNSNNWEPLARGYKLVGEGIIISAIPNSRYLMKYDY